MLKITSNYIENGLVVSFIVISSLFFSSVPPISKLVLLTILGVIFIINGVISTHLNNLTKKNIFVLIFFIIYLVLNTFLLSKIKYDSKQELVNFFIYGLTFVVFSSICIEKLEKFLATGFLAVLSVTMLFYLSGSGSREDIIYFFFYNANIFAGHCLMILFFSFGCIEEEIGNKYVNIFNFCVSLIFLFLLKSYAAIFVVFLVGGLIVRKYYKISITSFVIIIVSIFLIGITINFQTTIDRVLWIYVAIRVFVNNIIFGVGLGNFKYFYLPYSGDLFPSSATTFVHNYFLQFACETGVVGVVFLFLILKNVFVYYEKKNFFYALVAGLILNIFDYNLYIPQNGILFAVMFAAHLRVQNEKIPVNSKKEKYEVLILVILSLVYSWWSVYRFNKIEKLFKHPDEQNLREIISIDKSCWQAYFNIAQIEIANKRLFSARENISYAIKYNPVYGELYFYLSLVDKKISPKNSISYKNLHQAVKLNPKASKKYIKYFNSIQ